MTILNRLFAPFVFHRWASRLTLALLASPLVIAPATAQQPKQISYEVKVPVPQAAASSAPAPVYTAPAPVIRPVAEAASVPVRPKTTKATKARSDTQAASQSDNAQAASKKSVAQKPAPTKKTAAAKTPTKAPEKTSKTTAKTPKASAIKTATAKAAVPKPTATKAALAKTTAPATAEKKTPNPNAVLAANPNNPVSPTISTPQPSNQLSVNKPATAAPSRLATGPTVGAGAMVAGAALGLSANAGDDEASGEDLGEQEEPDLSPEHTPEPISQAAPVAAPASNYSLIPRANAQPLQVSAARERFVSEFQQIVEKKLVPYAPGVAVAVIADGRIRVLETYGVKRARTQDAINSDTLFRLASVSKSFGATAAALLARDGLISWDSTITSLLPQVEFSNPRYGDQLTVRNIMSQSTGLPTQANSNFIEEGQSFDEVVRRLRNVSFICPPGKCYNYQNVTYSLIAPIIQKKTGKTYEQYVTERIFAPLGMHTATFGMAGFKANNNYASPHVGTRKGWTATDVNENYYRFAPAAGINASISDMARWVLAQLGHNPEVLPPMVLNTVQDKVTRNTPAQNHYGSREGVTDSHYGLGWRIFDYRGDKNFVHHGGGVQGFRSEVVFNRELQIGMVVLTNTGRMAGDIIFDFLDAYEDEKRGERRPSAAAKAAPKKPVLKKKN